MKTKNLILTGLLLLAPIIGFAQEWDDIYANPAKNQRPETEKVRQRQSPQKKKIVVVEGKASNMEVRANGRNIDEYNREHIEGSVNVPLSSIDKIDYEKDAFIIVYCQSGMRSVEAAKKLNKLGYTNLYNLDGGLINWGFDLVK